MAAEYLGRSLPEPEYWLSFQPYHDEVSFDHTKSTFLTSFSNFSKLPTELRLAIWEHVVQQPRVIMVACLEKSTATKQKAQLAVRSRGHLVPPLLHVNREARALGLKHYEIAFRWKVPRILARASSGWERGGIFNYDTEPRTSMESDTAAVDDGVNGNNIGPHMTAGQGLSCQTSSSPPASQTTPAKREGTSQIYFNFSRDGLFLLGDLEPRGPDGLRAAMSYFLQRHETERVRKLIIAFGTLGFGEAGYQDIFSTLFHVVDRFRGVEGRRVLVSVTGADEALNAELGAETTLVEESDGLAGSNVPGRPDIEATGVRNGWKMLVRPRRRSEANVVQRIWQNWYRGSIVMSSLSDVRFQLIREADLEKHVAMKDPSGRPDEIGS